MIFKTRDMFHAKIKYKNVSLSDENKVKNASRRILEMSSWQIFFFRLKFQIVSGDVYDNVVYI